MMVMNHYLPRIIIACLAILFLTGCKKYPEGPSFSISGKKSRLCNNWSLDKTYVNGSEDTTGHWTFYRMTIKRNGTYSLAFDGGCCADTYSENGTWHWTDEKIKVTFKYKGQGSTNGFGIVPLTDGEHSFEIRRLKQQELWLRQKQTNGEIWDLHFKTYHP